MRIKWAHNIFFSNYAAAFSLVNFHIGMNTLSFETLESAEYESDDNAHIHRGWLCQVNVPVTEKDWYRGGEKEWEKLCKVERFERARLFPQKCR